ncbi:MAG: hypothetical protein ACK5TK_04440 [Betaproteobacteria bacterium]
MAIPAADPVSLTVASAKFSELECEQGHLLLLDEAEKGLADVDAGRTRDARTALAELKRGARERR